MRTSAPKNHARVDDISCTRGGVGWMVDVKWTDKKMKAKDFRSNLLKMKDSTIAELSPGWAIVLGFSKPALKVDDAIPLRKK
jgi:hypothetical protein